MQIDLPCGRILDCWFERLPIQQYIGDHFSRDEQKQVFEPLKPKMQVLATLAGTVKKDTQD